MVSCGTSKIEFSNEPVVVENSNKSTPLTCFVDFETESPFENVKFLISDSDREYELQSSSDEKMEQGYLILLMRPAQENKIKVEITSDVTKIKSADKVVFPVPDSPKKTAVFSPVVFDEQCIGK